MSTQPSAPLLVGVAGGTASGKTSLARVLQKRVGQEHSTLLELDAYYKDLSHLSFEEREKVNFDHPDAFDWDLLASHLDALRAGKSIELPVYDYATHNRKPEPLTVPPTPVILLEGILVLWKKEIRERMDIRVFVDTAPDVRLIRRIRRDTVERGRSLENVLEQFELRVRPAHLEFCAPSMEFADIIIPRGSKNRVAVEMVRTRLVSLLDPTERARGRTPEA